MKLARTLLVPCGTFLLLAAPLNAETSAPVLITMASDEPEVKSHIQQGLRDYLMGWNEMASVHFRAAVERDKSCALGWCGLMLAQGYSATEAKELDSTLSESVFITPQESDLLSSVLRIICGDRAGAGQEFEERAGQYRNDSLSACFAIMLLQERYSAGEKRRLEIAQQLYERKPDHSLLAYLRGRLEESVPEPSDEALRAAEFAAEQMPEHPAAQLLYGHLLYRKGQLEQAIPYLHLAAEHAEKARKNVPHGTSEQVESEAFPLECAELEIRAKLYESTLLWLNGQKSDSAKLQSELLRYTRSIKPVLSTAPAAVLLKWEAETLSLRLLMGCPHELATKVVPAASSLDKSKGDAWDCLRLCFMARRHALNGDKEMARRCLRSAEARLKALDVSRGTIEGQGSYVLSARARAREACEQALLLAKLAVYPDTSEIWLRSLEEATRPATLLMPPVLPRK